MIEILTTFYVGKRRSSEILEEKQPSNVNTNTKRHKHKPRYPFVFQLNLDKFSPYNKRSVLQVYYNHPEDGNTKLRQKFCTVYISTRHLMTEGLNLHEINCLKISFTKQ
jgi:hypothetical protein